MTTGCQYRYPQSKGHQYAGTLCTAGAFAFEHDPNNHRTCDMEGAL